MTSPARVRTVAAILDAFAARDAEAFVAEMTEDVRLAPSAFITGKNEYRGRQEVLDGFAEMERNLEASHESVRVRPVQYYLDEADDDIVLVLAQITITRANSEEFGTEIAYLWTMAGDRVAELQAWLDHGEGVRRLTSPVEVDEPA
jgi:ketosteroid isomerase-like protein